MDSLRLDRQRPAFRTGSVERVVFLVAVAVIAVHVLDDSFIQPQPGTSAGDHLVSGLVPLAALAIAAVVYLRARGGVRATLALLIGLFGIVASLEGWHYTMEVGALGDDYTGLVTLPAGMVLLLLGVVTLWRSRRSEGSRARRYLRRVLTGAVGLVVAILLVQSFMASYAYTHLARAVVPDADLGGAAYENVKFATPDGLELEGWYIPSKNRAAVISFPGRSGSRTPARFLARHGYGVLLFGAGIRSVREANEVSGGVEKWLQVTAMASMTVGTAIFSNNSPPGNLKDLVGRIAPRPVFLIYADRGQGGEELTADFYQAAGDPKQLWKTVSGHTGGHDADPNEYERRVVRFFDASL
jgi:uncharacterized membrane protein